MYGALLVLEPGGAVLTLKVDHVVVIGGVGSGKAAPIVLNGGRDPLFIWKAGGGPRRLINITPDDINVRRLGRRADQSSGGCSRRMQRRCRRATDSSTRLADDRGRRDVRFEYRRASRTPVALNQRADPGGPLGGSGADCGRIKQLPYSCQLLTPSLPRLPGAESTGTHLPFCWFSATDSGYWFLVFVCCPSLQSIEQKACGQRGQAGGDHRDGPRRPIEPLAAMGDQDQRRAQVQHPGVVEAFRWRRWLSTITAHAAAAYSQSIRSILLRRSPASRSAAAWRTARSCRADAMRRAPDRTGAVEREGHGVEQPSVDRHRDDGVQQ